MRMLAAFGLLIGGPFVLIAFPTQTLSILMTIGIVGGVVYVGYALVEIVRAYRRWAIRRVARSRGAGTLSPRLALAGLLMGGAFAGLLLLPAYLAYAALSGMASAGASPTHRSHDTISLAGFVAVAVVVLLVFTAPILGFAYVLTTAFLFWFHRTRLRIQGRPPTVGIGGLIDWLEHDAASG